MVTKGLRKTCRLTYVVNPVDRSRRRPFRKISFGRNHAEQDFREVTPETVLTEAGMEHHGKREHALVDAGPPGPVGRTDLAIRGDGDGVPEIAGEEGRHVHGGITRSAAPDVHDHVRTLVDTLPHELVADPALVALRHAVLGCVCVWVLNMKCAESGYTREI